MVRRTSVFWEFSMKKNSLQCFLFDNLVSKQRSFQVYIRPVTARAPKVLQDTIFPEIIWSFNVSREIG